MSRSKYLIAALILVSLAMPAVAAAESRAFAKRHVTQEKQRNAAACQNQATAQNHHFGARVDFESKCLRSK
jgi:hypothetical protein